MSRVIVKNLPKRVSEDQLKNQFSKIGNITDINLKYKKDGEFRRYAFIGFEKEEDAAAAFDYFQDTFIGNAKVTVEVCQDYGSTEKPVAWAEVNKQRREKKPKKSNEEEGDTCLEKKEDEKEETEEKDRLALKVDVSNTDYLRSLQKSQDIDGDDRKRKKKKTKVWKEYHTIVIRAKEMCKSQQKTFVKKTVKAFLKPLKYKSLRIPRNIRYVAYVGFQTEKEMNQALQKDKSFLDGVRVHVLKYEKPNGVAASGGGGRNTPWSAAEEKLKSAEPVAESGKIFVRNLWYSATEEDLQELFSQYGEVTDVTLPICKFTRRNKGVATVTFMFPDHAVKAMTELDGKNFKGRLMHILPAIEAETQKTDNLSFKEKKAEDQKATAGSWHNWNTLFMGSSTVVDIMSEKYNRSKREILNSEGKQSVAVNLALGEAQIVDETKRFLVDNGISLEAFSKPGVQRSSTVMLVKNLPAQTTAQELSKIFGRYGELGRVVLPPSGVSGVVEFLNPGEAKKAFRSLAYSKFKHLPLYLEWAPIQVFTEKFIPKPKEEKDQDVAQETEEDEDDHKEDQQVPDTGADPEPDTTIYVKNLNFSTTEEGLQQHFEKLGPVYSVMIAKRRGLSQGYGFVQYMRKRDAKKALKELNESSLEDHTLQIKLSEKTLMSTVKSVRRMHSAGKQTSSKILVRNIPFQATHAEVRQLFATFGELKTVRLPKKPGTYEHRGFGFVDYVSRDDAKKAFEALALSTHLYDRRLVLEWAKEEETVEELRKKTADHFLAAGPTKKRAKFEVTSNVKADFEED